MNAAAVQEIHKARDALEAEIEVALWKFQQATGLEVTDIEVETVKQHDVTTRKQQVVKYLVYARARL